jgi:hypothetical protein
MVQGKHHKLGGKRRHRRSKPSNSPNYWDNRVSPFRNGQEASARSWMQWAKTENQHHKRN